VQRSRKRPSCVCIHVMYSMWSNFTSQIESMVIGVILFPPEDTLSININNIAIPRLVSWRPSTQLASVFRNFSMRQSNGEASNHITRRAFSSSLCYLAVRHGNTVHHITETRRSRSQLTASCGESTEKPHRVPYVQKWRAFTRVMLYHMMTYSPSRVLCATAFLKNTKKHFQYP